MTLKPGKKIEFDMKKQFQYVRKLGDGGTGETHLFKERITETYFAIKKYEPIQENDNDRNFLRFIDEIKILFKIMHPHIVRIYNYYLYEDFRTGYLQMEFVEGESIDNYNPVNRGKDWESIFIELISAFKYLESRNILHRDIRPQNILINKDNDVKVIDFGFGKELTEKEGKGKSVFLNWPYTTFPEEIEKNEYYDFQTEVYFVGSLFKGVLKDNYEDFKYKQIVEKMIEYKRENRINSFKEVTDLISNLNINSNNFTDLEKEIYNKFANALINSINKFHNEFKPNTNVDSIKKGLEELLSSSLLEHTIQNNSRLIRIFISNGYNYKKKSEINVDTVKKFYEMFTENSKVKQKIIIDNLVMRLETIDVDAIYDDLPF